MSEPRGMIEQMQAFWTGDARAAALLDAHPLLAAVPREALLETVRRGCGFHSIWDVRALGQLRDVLDRAAAATDGGAAATALSELHAALAAGGGLRAQARAVGMLLFRVAAREYGELQEEEQHSTGDTAAATAALTAPVGGGAVEQALAQEPEHRQDQQHQLEQPTLPAASPPRGSSHQAPPSPPLAQNHTMSASSMSLGGISSISSPGSFSGSSELPTTAGAGAATCAADAAACAFPRRYRLSRWLPPGAVLRVRTAAGIGPGSTVIGLLGAGVECEAVAEKRLPPSDGHGGGAEHWVEVRLAGLRLAPPPPAETTSSSEVGAAAPTAWVMATMPPAAAAAAAAAAATHPPPVCNWGPGLCEDGAAATHYCGSCAEHLCAECLATHRRARATRSHTAAVAAKPAPGSAAAAARLAPLLEGVMPFGGSGGCGDSSNTSGDGFSAAVFSAAMMSSSSVSSVGTVSAAGASLVSSESHGGAGSGCFLDQSSLSLSMSEVSNIVDRSGPGAVEAVVSHALAPTATDAAHNGAAAAQDSEAEPAAAEEFDAAAVAAAAAASSAVAAAAAASVAMNAAAAEVERARECEAEMRRQATSAAISSAVIAAITAARCAANDAIDAADRAIGAAASAAAQAVSTAAVDEDQVDEERRRRRKKAQATEVLEDEQKAVDSAAKRRATEQAASAEATAAAAVQAFAAAAAATAAADDAVADANAVAAHEAAVAAETAAEAAAADAEESAIAADERESLTAATAATSSRRAALRAEIEQLDAGLGGEGWKVRLAALQRFVAAALALAAADAAATAVARAEAATRRALRGRRCGNGSDRRRVRAVVPATVSSAEAGASADLSLSLWRLASLLGDIMADKSQHAQVAREVARTVELLSAGHALGTDAAGCRCSDAVVAEGSAVRGGAPASAMEPDIDASAVLSAAQVSSLSLDLSEDAVNDRDEDDDSGDSGDGATAGHNKAQRRDRCAAAAKVRSDARREAAALASRLVAPLLARLGCRDATLARAIGAALDKLYRHALPLRRCLRLTTPLLEAPPAPKSTRLGSPDRGDSSRGPRAARSTPPKRAGVNGGTAASATLGSGASPADGPLSAPKQQAPPLARARVLGWLGRCMLSAYRHRLALLQVQQRQQQEAGTSPRGQEAHQHEQVERWLVFTPAPPELASLLLPSLTDREQKVRAAGRRALASALLLLLSPEPFDGNEPEAAAAAMAAAATSRTPPRSPQRRSGAASSRKAKSKPSPAATSAATAAVGALACLRPRRLPRPSHALLRAIRQMQAGSPALRGVAVSTLAGTDTAHGEAELPGRAWRKVGDRHWQQVLELMRVQVEAEEKREADEMAGEAAGIGDQSMVCCDEDEDEAEEKDEDARKGSGAGGDVVARNGTADDSLVLPSPPRRSRSALAIPTPVLRAPGTPPPPPPPVPRQQERPLSSSADADIVAAQRQRGWHRRIAAFYAEHNPARAADVPRILLQWRGEESKLWQCLQEKYCDAATAMATPRGPDEGRDADSVGGMDDLDAILDKSFDFGSADKQTQWLYDPSTVSPTATASAAVATAATQDASGDGGGGGGSHVASTTPSRLPRPPNAAAAQRRPSSHAARSSGSSIPAPSRGQTTAEEWWDDHTVLFDSDGGTNPAPALSVRQSQWIARLAEFYAVHNPAKISEAEHILSQWVGQEEEMFVCLQQKYGVSDAIE